jgi:diguanylate cyclase (GGDEF)-like protein/PAS domain S-box-containing protein
MAETDAANDGEVPGEGKAPGQGKAPRRGKIPAAARMPIAAAERWRELARLAADLAFEIDRDGRFTFLFPETALGWPAATLLGQPAELLLAAERAAPGFNPFRPDEATPRKSAWMRRADGSLAHLLLTLAPQRNETGRIVGVRGVAVDITGQQDEAAPLPGALRRGRLLDHILGEARRDVLAPRMMQAVLDQLLPALGAEGAAVFDLDPAGTDNAVVLHHAGANAAQVMPAVPALFARGGPHPVSGTTGDGRKLLAGLCGTRLGAETGFVLWRGPHALPWDVDDRQLAISAGTIIRAVLDHLAAQQETSSEAQTDPLTGLLNRRAFLEEVSRRLDRLAFDELPGTLMLVDLDRLDELNGTGGREVGDAALLVAAGLLRETVRPADLIARLGDDAFAVWLDGADHLAAAERAEQLRWSAPERMSPLAAGRDLPLTMSIGIATRDPHSDEGLHDLVERAGTAMYAVKRDGRGHWRVAHRRPPV